MEPITLCGAVIVVFGLWVEFEPRLRAVIWTICNSKFYKETISQSKAYKPAYVGRMPICVAKMSH